MDQGHQIVEHFFRHESGRLMAGLVRRFGIRQLEVLEDAVQTALVRAMQSWPGQGIPPQPERWLSRVATNAAIDSLRRAARQAQSIEPQIEQLADGSLSHAADAPAIEDDSLRLLFCCCDPSISLEAQLAVALKLVCGFGVGEIAKALLVSDAAIQKRLTRAKETLKLRGPELFQRPAAELIEHQPAVLAILYLLFNEGYHSSSPEVAIRRDLCAEAIRQVSLLAAHPLFGSTAAEALLALMLLHAARLEHRESASGELLLLEDQDRSRWDSQLIADGLAWLARSARGSQLSAYHLEAAIAAEHVQAESFAATNWPRIVELYDLLCAREPSWPRELNRAIALAFVAGPQAGIARLLAIQDEPARRYSHWHAAVGELYRRIGQLNEAAQSLERAASLAGNPGERNLLERRLAEVLSQREQSNPIAESAVARPHVGAGRTST